MGCRKSRPVEDRQTVENLRIRKYENTLSLSSVSSFVYEASIRRLIRSKQPLMVGFDKMLETLELSVPDVLHSALESWINESGNFNTLFVYLILLGKGKDKVKRDCIWYLFDEEMQDELTKPALSELFESVVEASCSFSLDAAIQSEDSEDHRNRLTHWKKEAKEKSSRLVQRLLKHFLEEKTVLRKEEFVLKLMDRPFGNILDLQGIRSQIDETQVIPNKFANPFKNMKVTRLQTSA